MIRVKFVIGLIIIILIACNKENLNKKTDKSLVVPESLKDLQAILDNTSIMNEKSATMQEVACDGHFISEPSWSLPMQDYDRNAYTWSHQWPNLNEPDWNGLYQRIFNCNVVLEGVGKLHPEDINDMQKLRDIKGQALFSRAKSFFELAQLFAPPYIESSSTTDLSIVLRLSSDINIASVRSNNKQVYAQINNDLLQAKDLLPVSPSNNFRTRACKPAAFGLLARVYLTMEDYNKAAVFADSCLSLHNALLTYSNTSQVSTTGRPVPIFCAEVIFHDRMNISSAFLSSSTYIVDTTLFNSYSINDIRKQAFFTAATPTYFEGTYSGNARLFSGIASDEMFLIRAECTARLGNKDSAIADLNRLLFTRWKSNSFVNYTAASADEALIKILTERRKELIGRGLRWSDLRRLNRDSRFAVTITRVIGGNTYTLLPNSYKYTFPIPDDIIQITGIPQNPGW
jgi:hypothetical protein